MLSQVGLQWLFAPPLGDPPARVFDVVALQPQVRKGVLADMAVEEGQGGRLQSAGDLIALRMIHPQRRAFPSAQRKQCVTRVGVANVDAVFTARGHSIEIRAAAGRSFALAVARRFDWLASVVAVSRADQHGPLLDWYPGM